MSWRIACSFLIGGFVLASVGCATPHAYRGSRGPASAIESSNFDVIDSRCYREFFQRANRSYSLPWGAEGPITIPLGEISTEVRWGQSGNSTSPAENWSRQSAMRFGIIDGERFLQLELIPYDRTAFGRACRQSDSWSAVAAVEVTGRRFVVLEGTAEFAGVYDLVTGVPLGNHGSSLLGKPFDRCLYRETQRQTFEYLSWETSLKARGIHVVPVESDSEGTYLKARPMPEELREKALADLRKNVAETAQSIYRQYNSRVRHAKESSGEKSMVAPSAEDLLSTLDVDSCLASAVFAPVLDTARSRILSCQDAYSARETDCTQ